MVAPSNKRNQTSFLNEGTKLISYCPLCGSSYTPLQTQVLEEKDESHLMHIQCGNCANAILALVTVTPVGVSSVGLVTDLDVEEVERFKKDRAVSTDDVIDMHHLLQNEDELFAQLANTT